MDWLILLLLVPAILVPLVLLCGFAGCVPAATRCATDDDCPQGTVCGEDGVCFAAFVDPPECLTATAVSDTEIALSWCDDPDATGFQIERAEDGDQSFTKIQPGVQTRTSATDTLLPEGTTFFYRIEAITDQGTSGPSSTASATTFHRVLSAPFVTLDTSERRRGDCIVQRIGADRLLNGGTQVRITLQPPDIDSLTLVNVTISHADTAAGADPFDSEAQPTVVARNLVIAAGGADVTTPPVAFTLDNNKPLLIAFDVSSQNGQDRVSFGSLQDPETKAFTRNNRQDALTQDRSNFNPVDGVYLIKQILVL